MELRVRCEAMQSSMGLFCDVSSQKIDNFYVKATELTRGLSDRFCGEKLRNPSLSKALFLKKTVKHARHFILSTTGPKTDRVSRDLAFFLWSIFASFAFPKISCFGLDHTQSPKSTRSNWNVKEIHLLQYLSFHAVA